MHDGSIATLSEVLDHYAAGGRASAHGAGPSLFQSEFVRGFTLTDQEKQDVLAFLESLTDPEFLTDPRFSDPFAATAASSRRALSADTTMFAPASPAS
jgi:cytochrome c peroxidase